MHVFRERRENLLQAGLCQVRPAGLAAGRGGRGKRAPGGRLGRIPSGPPPGPGIPGLLADCSPLPAGLFPPASRASVLAWSGEPRAGKPGRPLTRALGTLRRLFGIKCAKCQVGFSSSDLVMRARDSVYHIECFRCSVCSRQLLPGDEFSLREHELLCRADHGLLLERAAAGSPRSPGPLPGARGLHLPGKPHAGDASKRLGSREKLSPARDRASRPGRYLALRVSPRACGERGRGCREETGGGVETGECACLR